MRVYILMLFVGLLAVFPGFAAAEEASDFKIRVIQDDGTVQEVDVSKPAPPPPPQKAAPRPRPPSQEARAPRVRDSDLVQPSEIEPSWVERNIGPAELAAPVEREYEAQPDETVTSPPTRTAYAPSDAGRIPLPPRKPAAAPAVPAPGTISADLAANIALDNAPAAQGFKVHEDVYEGRHVFAVVFATDSGPYEVLVDSANGDVVYKGGIAAENPVQATSSKWPVARR